MRKFPVVYMRGGTSKGIMFLEKDLPGREEWDDIFVQCMGSPDPKQIDGVRIGHPSGVMTMFPYMDDPTLPDPNLIQLSGVAVQRTARRIMDGSIYISR